MLTIFFDIGTLNPKVLLELFSMYREWQEEKAKKISQKQVIVCVVSAIIKLDLSNEMLRTSWF